MDSQEYSLLLQSAFQVSTLTIQFRSCTISSQPRFIILYMFIYTISDPPSYCLKKFDQITNEHTLVVSSATVRAKEDVSQNMRA